MHKTIAFCQVGAVTTEEAIDAVADQTARTSGDDHFIGKYNQIVSMFAGGKYTQTFRLVSPSLRRNFCPYIHPYLSESTDAYWVVKPVYLPESPIPLETNEALNAMVVCSQAADAIHNFVGVSLAEGALTPVEFQEKHSRRLKAASVDMRTGVEKITVSPTAQAAEKIDKMRAHLIEAIDSGKTARRLKAVSLEEWKSKMLTKGVGRVAEGIDQAKDKVIGFAEQLLPAVAAAQAEIKALPDLTLEDNINRMTTYIRRMSKFEKK